MLQDFSYQKVLSWSFNQPMDEEYVCLHVWPRTFMVTPDRFLIFVSVSGECLYTRFNGWNPKVVYSRSVIRDFLFFHVYSVPRLIYTSYTNWCYSISLSTYKRLYRTDLEYTLHWFYFVNGQQCSPVKSSLVNVVCEDLG